MVVHNADGRLYVMKSERKGQKTGIKGKSVLAANSLGARAIGPQQRVGDHSGHNHQLGVQMQDLLSPTIKCQVSARDGFDSVEAP